MLQPARAFLDAREQKYASAQRVSLCLSLLLCADTFWCRKGKRFHRALTEKFHPFSLHQRAAITQATKAAHENHTKAESRGCERRENREGFPQRVKHFVWCGCESGWNEIQQKVKTAALSKNKRKFRPDSVARPSGEDQRQSWLMPVHEKPDFGPARELLPRSTRKKPQRPRSEAQPPATRVWLRYMREAGWTVGKEWEVEGIKKKKKIRLKTKMPYKNQRKDFLKPLFKRRRKKNLFGIPDKNIFSPPARSKSGFSFQLNIFWAFCVYVCVGFQWVHQWDTGVISGITRCRSPELHLGEKQRMNFAFVSSLTDTNTQGCGAMQELLNCHNVSQNLQNMFFAKRCLLLLFSRG